MERSLLSVGNAGADRQRFLQRDAMQDYLRAYERRGGKDARNIRSAIRAHILPHLGDVRVDRLTRRRVTEWHQELAAASPRLRTRAGTPASPRRRVIDPSDTDAIRCRRASANRVLSVLKAAMNHAHHEGRIHSTAAWASVKPFREVDAPRIRFLTDEEIARLVNACEPGLREIVVASILTGMRYGEITRLRGFDVNAEVGTITVAVSKSGKARHI